MSVTALIASVFGVGTIKPAPGTWGSLAALPLAWFLHVIGGPVLVILGTIAVFALGYWATQVETQGKEDHDPSWIVVDEVVGQWIALWPVSIGAAMAGTNFLALWPGIVTAFVAFRFFDILKPGPVGLADRQENALGVMLDDVVAGWLAAMIVALFAVFAHVIFAG